ncbi:MAG: VWA domain-containing protein [Thermoanaerobaculia bacterium]
MKIRALLLLPLALAAPLPAQQRPAANAAAAANDAPPSFGETVDVNVVNVEVYVTDKDGRRITGLDRKDFTLLEDGKELALTNFEAVSPAGRSGPAIQSGRGGLEPAAAPASEAAPPADPDEALSLVVFVDNQHVRPENRKRTLEQVRKFLDQTVKPGDRVLFATNDLGLHVRQPFTDDRAALDAALAEIETLPAFGMQEDNQRRSAFRTFTTLNTIHFCGIENVAPIEAFAIETRERALRSLGAMTLLINSLSGVPGRKALLFVSDGISTTPGQELFQAVYDVCSGSSVAQGVAPTGDSSTLGEKMPGGKFAEEAEGELGAKYRPEQAALDALKYSLSQRFIDLAAHANANRVTFYTLQASGLRGFASADAESEPGLRLLTTGAIQQIQRGNLKDSLTALAVDTGGRAMLDVNDFLPELARMQEDFESYYSLGYTPVHTGDGKQHRIAVKVNRPGVRVRYRQTYRDKPVMEKAADRTLAALLHGLEENPLGIEMTVGDPLPGEAGLWAVPVRLRIPLFKLAILNQEQTYEGRLRLLVATSDAKGGTSAVRQVEVPLKIPRKEVLSAMGQYYLYTLTLKMPAGDQRVAVAIRDDLAAQTSYLTRPVKVGEQAASSRR